MSENVVNIYQRLHKIMQQVSYVQKEDKKVNGQYSYVSHDAVSAQIRPALIENGVVVVPSIVKLSQNGNKTLVELSVKFVNVDKPDDIVEVISYGEGVDNQDKGIGKSYSYAYKYALLKMFALSTGDDPERDNIDHKPQENKPDPVREAFARIRNDLEKLEPEKLADYWDENIKHILAMPEAGQAALQAIYDKRAPKGDNEAPF